MLNLDHQFPSDSRGLFRNFRLSFTPLRRHHLHKICCRRRYAARKVSIYPGELSNLLPYLSISYIDKSILNIIALQILLSTWQAAAHNCHGARYTRHTVSLRQLSQQSGDQGWAATHPEAMRTALLLAHAGHDLLPGSQHGSGRTSAFCWVLETVSCPPQVILVS